MFELMKTSYESLQAEVINLRSILYRRRERVRELEAEVQRLTRIHNGEAGCQHKEPWVPGTYCCYDCIDKPVK